MRRTAVAIVAAAFAIAAPLGVAHAHTATVKTEASVAWAKIQGAWTQSKGAVREQWEAH